MRTGNSASEAVPKTGDISQVTLAALSLIICNRLIGCKAQIKSLHQLLVVDEVERDAARLGWSVRHRSVPPNGQVLAADQGCGLCRRPELPNRGLDHQRFYE